MAVLPFPSSPAPAAGPPSPAAGAMPLAGLAGRGAGGALPQGMQEFMIFLAGLGFPEFARTMDKMRNPHPKGQKGAMGKEAAGNPAMTNPGQAQMIARLAQMRQQAGAQPGGAPPAPTQNPLAFAR